jgi:hypothetical protein
MGAPMLLHNDSPPGNHWLSLTCCRRKSRTPALGAFVTVRAGDRKWIAEERSAGSYLSSNAPGMHFGLGSHARVDGIHVRWPDGMTADYPSVAADRAYRVDEGEKILAQ